MSPALVERVLDTWERGVDLNVQERATFALEIAGDSRDFADLAVHERDMALVDLRRSLFGDSFEAVVCCPACAEVFDLGLDLSALEPVNPGSEPMSVEAAGFSARVRPPTSSDLVALPRASEPDYAAALFARCVSDATHAGAPIDAEALPAVFREAAAAALSERGMDGPAADLTCGDCGHDWRAPIDIARAVLDDLDDWARRLLDDVHRLARAYHWSERDIIALPMRRRLFYLEAIG